MTPAGTFHRLPSGLWVVVGPPVPPPVPPPIPPPPPSLPPDVCRGGCGKFAPRSDHPLGWMPDDWQHPWYCCGHERPALCAECYRESPGCSVCGCQAEYT